MKVLIACEYSGIVREAFKAKGHDAWSCDLLDTEIPGNHIKGDVLKILNDGWDLMIAHPPCTYLSGAGLHWLHKDPSRQAKLEEGVKFFLGLWNSSIKKICLENPCGYMNTKWRKPTQIIQPFYFGDNERKRTALWLKGLPRLNGDIEVAKNPKKYFPKPYQTIINKKGRKINVYFSNRIEHIGNGHARSKFFLGTAKAMAEQWG